MKIELKLGVVIEAEDEDSEDLFDFGDIGELIAADLYEMLYNGDDYVEVYYRGAEKHEYP